LVVNTGRSLHLFQHQIHHRGQVHAMLAGTGGCRKSRKRLKMPGSLARSYANSTAAGNYKLCAISRSGAAGEKRNPEDLHFRA